MNTLLIDRKGKKTLISTEERKANTQYGIISETDLNKLNGGLVKTHTGKQLLAVKPSFQDMVESMKMGSRPIYPYDSGIMSAMLSIKKGTKVLESGTGSGGNTIYLAELGAEIDTWEKEKRFYDIAEKNLAKYKNVKTHYGNVLEQKLKREFYDVIFLDLQNPSQAIEQIDYSLRIGGFVGVYSPIMDDIKPVWRKLEERGYFDIRAIQLDLKEVIVKKYARVKGLLGYPGWFIWGRKGSELKNDEFGRN